MKNGQKENKNLDFKGKNKQLSYQVGGKKNRVYGELDLREGINVEEEQKGPWLKTCLYLQQKAQILYWN